MESSQRGQGGEYWDTLRCTNGLAELYTVQLRFAEAEPLFIEALEISSSTLGEEHPWTLTTMNSLAAVYKERNDLDKAESLFLEALNGRRLKLGDTHPHTINNHAQRTWYCWCPPEGGHGVPPKEAHSTRIP